MQKLEALKQYLQFVLNNKDSHNWAISHKCHCGMLLRSLDLYNDYNVSNAFNRALNYGVGKAYYSRIFSLYKDAVCDVTELPFTEILHKLIAIGFTVDELINLEELRDNRFGTFKEFDLVDNLIQYLTNWINYEEQLVKATTKDSVKVTVTSM